MAKAIKDQKRGVYVIRLRVPKVKNPRTLEGRRQCKQAASAAIMAFKKNVPRLKAFDPELEIQVKQDPLLALVILTGKSGLGRKIRALPNVTNLSFTPSDLKTASGTLYID